MPTTQISIFTSGRRKKEGFYNGNYQSRLDFPIISMPVRLLWRMSTRNMISAPLKAVFYPIIQSTGAPELRPALIGEPVALVVDKMPDNYDPFFGGYAKSQKNRYMVRIQISGIAAVKYSGSIPTVGSYAMLGPDGAGGLKTVESGGRNYLVVASNTITKQI